MNEDQFIDAMAKIKAGQDTSGVLVGLVVGHEANLRTLLKEAKGHLEWIGYGDSYESGCAREDGLPKRLEEACEGTLTVGPNSATVVEKKELCHKCSSSSSIMRNLCDACFSAGEAAALGREK